MNAFGAPFMLEGLFGEADAEAMDADPDSEPGVDNIGMDVEDDAGSGPALGGMIVDEDTPCVLHPNPHPSSPLLSGEEMLIEQTSNDDDIPSNGPDSPCATFLRKCKRARIRKNLL